MGSPLGPIIAGIFMSELEKRFLPTLIDPITFWKRYVDDTFSLVKEESIPHILSVLNSFHRNIKFTHEVADSKRIPS